MSDIVGCNVYLKLENNQPSGSFKSRGLATLIHSYVTSSPTGQVNVYSSSGGNAGLAAATAAQYYKQPCTVVVPKSTTLAMVERIKLTGSQVIIHGDHWAQADEYLRTHVMDSNDPNSVYCHPFDHRLIWEGNSTMIDEIKVDAEFSRPDTVIVAVGGGGLFNGVMQGLVRNGWSDVPVLAVETDQTDKLSKSLEQGKQVVLEKINTVATSLAAAYVSTETLKYAQNYNVFPTVVTDEDAIKGTVSFAQDHKMIVEPACGAALSVAYKRIVNDKVKLNSNSNVVVIVCGGTSTTLKTLAEWIDKYGDR